LTILIPNVKEVFPPLIRYDKVITILIDLFYAYIIYGEELNITRIALNFTNALKIIYNTVKTCSEAEQKHKMY